MGIRFKCHHCQAPLNIKSELALRRGICPQCQGKFRIPPASQEYSWSLDRDAAQIVASHDDIHRPAHSTSSASELQSSTEDETSSLSVDLPPNSLSEPVEPLYFVRPPSGGEYGPAPRETIELWIAQRRVTAETLVCLMGTSKWIKAREIFSTLFSLNSRSG